MRQEESDDRSKVIFLLIFTSQFVLLTYIYTYIEIVNCTLYSMNVCLPCCK